MFEVIDYITFHLDKNDSVMALFLDLKKAFDMVCHKHLLHKLRSLGIRGIALDWFTSYLKNRQQSVQIRFIDNDNCVKYYESNELQTKSGVPKVLY
jgi:hypothetical protein